MDELRRRRAYHAAGHAVVMVARGVTLGDVSIGGHGSAAQGAATADRRALVAVALAGCVAEDRFLAVADPTRRAVESTTPIVLYHTGDDDARSETRFRHDETATDFRSAGRDAVRVAGAPRPEMREAAFAVLREEAAAALRDVEARWDAVVALAEGLLERETIPAADALAIVRAD